MIGVGVAGAGHFAAMHAQALANVPEFRIVAAASAGLAAATAFTATYGGRPYADWQYLLDDPAVDVVLITLPHHLHAPAAIAAARAGKPIAAVNRGRTRGDHLFALKIEQPCDEALAFLNRSTS